MKHIMYAHECRKCKHVCNDQSSPGFQTTPSSCKCVELAQNRSR